MILLRKVVFEYNMVENFISGLNYPLKEKVIVLTQHNPLFSLFASPPPPPHLIFKTRARGKNGFWKIQVFLGNEKFGQGSRCTRHVQLGAPKA